MKEVLQKEDNLSEQSCPVSANSVLLQNESENIYIAKTIEDGEDTVTVTGVEITYRKFQTQIAK